VRLRIGRDRRGERPVRAGSEASLTASVRQAVDFLDDAELLCSRRSDLRSRPVHAHNGGCFLPAHRSYSDRLGARPRSVSNAPHHAGGYRLTALPNNGRTGPPVNWRALVRQAIGEHRHEGHEQPAYGFTHQQLLAEGRCESQSSTCTGDAPIQKPPVPPQQATVWVWPAPASGVTASIAAKATNTANTPNTALCTVSSKEMPNPYR